MLSDLLSRVRDNTQDWLSQRWSDTVITQHLNDCQRKLSQLSYGITAWQVSVTSSPPPGDPTFVDGVTRPPQLLTPHKVYFQIGMNQWELNLSHGVPIDTAYMTGLPDTAYFAAGTIYLRPYPSQNGTLIVSGTQRTTDMSVSTDVPTLEDADDVMVSYATWMCLASDGDPTATFWERIYQDKRQEWAVLEAQKHPTANRIAREWWE